MAAGKVVSLFMSSVSVRIPDSLLEETDAIGDGLHVYRAAYLREALERMNALGRAQRRRERLMDLSRPVRRENAAVNAEFHGIDDVSGA